MSGGFTLIGTVAGATLGSLAGGPGMGAGAQIGATLGALLDGLTAQDQARVADARWSGSTYGTAICRGWGSGRTDCQIIYAERNPSDGSYVFPGSSSSKKGGEQQHFNATFGIALLETGFTFPDGSQIERKKVLKRLWMADKIVWQSSTLAAWSSTTTYFNGDYAVGSDSNTYISQADSNLNNDPTTSGATWWVLASTTTGNIGISLHPDALESTFTQVADSTMTTIEGVANCSANRGLWWGMVINMDLFPIGNQIPQTISAEWEEETPITDGEFLSDVCRFCGLSPSDFDFSNCTDTLTGMIQKAQTSGEELLAQFLQLKAYDLVTIDGKLTAVKRGGSVTVDIPDSDLSAVPYGSKLPDRLGATILADKSELHSHVLVLYRNAAQDFRQCGELAPRDTYTTYNVLQIQTDLTLSPDAAAGMAGFVLDSEWLEAGSEFSFSLPGSYGYLVPTDCVTVMYQGVRTRLRITSIEWVQNLIKCKAVFDDPLLLTRPERGDAGTNSISAAATITPTDFAVASPSVDFTDAFAAFPGFYVWVAPTNNGTGWSGAQVMYTFDAPGGSRTWSTGPFVAVESIFGTMHTALPNTSSPGPVTLGTAVVVTFAVGRYMELRTIPNANAGAGQQWALIGDEIVGIYQVPTTIPAGISFKGLYRMLRGSSGGGHSVGDFFACTFNISQMVKVQVPDAEVGQTVYVRCLSVGQTINDSNEESCVIATPTSAFTPNLPPLDPTSITVGNPIYNGATESISFRAVYASIPPAGQTLNWQYSTDGGSTWSGSVIDPVSYTPPGFTSGTLMTRAQAMTVDGRTGNWVDSSNETYAAPYSPTFHTETPGGSIDSSNVTFTLAHVPVTGSLILFLNGSPTAPGTDYTLASSTITMAVAPTTGATLLAYYSF